MDPNSPIQATPSPNPASVIKPKNNRTVLISGIIAGLATIAAVVFAVLFFLGQQPESESPADEPTQSQQSSAPSAEGTDLAGNQAIDIELAQSLINPYLKDFHYLNNVLDNDFSEEAKIWLAFLNTGSSSVRQSNEASQKVGYYSLNKSYQQLFGSESAITKQDYQSTSYTPDFLYDGATDEFTIGIYGSGGTGMAMFSIAKNAYIDGGNLIVEVYHDQIPLCDADPNDGYCCNSDNLPIDSDNAIFQNFADRIPVYKMIFAKDSGHYVLKDIRK